jgi:hypothetical protein
MSNVDFWLWIGLMVLATWLIIDVSIDHFKNKKKS